MVVSICKYLAADALSAAGLPEKLLLPENPNSDNYGLTLHLPPCRLY